MPLSAQDALVYLMVVTAGADETIADLEIERMGALISRLPVFKEYEQEQFVRTATQCVDQMNGALGLDGVLLAATDALPERLRDTAYSLCVEVAAVDLMLEQEELHLLEMIADRLAIDKLTVGAIEAAARARYRKP
jgi:uncharacterized tellurite resistance protein B-like protein